MTTNLPPRLFFRFILLPTVMCTMFAVANATDSDAIILHCRVKETIQSFDKSFYSPLQHSDLEATVTINNSIQSTGHRQITIRAVSIQPLFSIEVDTDLGPDHSYSFDRSDDSQWFIGLTDKEHSNTRTQFVKIIKGSGYFIYGDNISNSIGTTLKSVNIQGNCAD